MSRILSICFFVGVLIVFLGVYVFGPSARKACRCADKAKTINNLRQITMALREFEGEYGHFPHLNPPKDLELPQEFFGRTDSNALLSQLFLTHMLDSGEIFAAPANGVGRYHYVESSFPRSEILQAGENHMAYVYGLNGKPWSSDRVSAETPILIPHLRAGSSPFEKDLWRGGHLYARVDGSITEAKVFRSQSARRKTKELNPASAPSSESLWGSNHPDISYPLEYERTPPKKQSQRWLITGVIIVFILIIVTDVLTKKFKPKKS